MHGFAFFQKIINHRAAPVLGRLSVGQATALKATHKAGRRGGDSIVRKGCLQGFIPAPEHAVVRFSILRAMLMQAGAFAAGGAR
ncbi:hypothetical protein EAH77_11910 [Ewingella americana]|uniref:Uncharacterized protein n=1 Tax=Ewingella americana TaxID=41202 RepID=A0A502GJU4_9GAMM|nr:hypothetical protein EAH77_11910 [Ewingella americana]